MLLYLDNYRGFADTYVPIKNVNFLIGENSTGKTSLLSLLAIISGPRFWFNHEFAADGVQLGTFKDIVSAKANRPTSFKIGLVETEGKKPAAWLITFRDEHAQPAVSRFDYFHGGRATSIKFGEEIQFRTTEIESAKCTEDFLKDLVATWAKARHEGGFRKLEAKLPMGKRVPLPFLWSLGPSLDVNHKGDGLRGVSFEFPLPFAEVAWLAPVRSKPRRTYDELRIDFASEGEHTPYLMRRLLSEPQRASKFRQFLAKFGKGSDLFDTVAIRKFDKDPTSPFALNVVLDGRPINIVNVGYGVAQAIPVIVELFARRKGSWFSIQQPEIHLHPKAQAAVGEMVFVLASTENKRFLIETHSDYVVDRFRLKQRESQQKKVDAQVLFFERTEEGNRVHSISIGENGQYDSSQPASFRQFFIDEELDLLGLR